MNSPIFEAPTLGDRERAVLGTIERLKSRIQVATGGFGTPKKWLGSLRSTMQARAIQGSNSIEGYHVSIDDALAAVEGEELLESSSETRLAVTGYQSALTYVLRMASDPFFDYSNQLLKSLHFMMLQHRPEKNPGLWRPGSIHVAKQESGEVVYQGPDVELLPELMDRFVSSLGPKKGESVVVNAAMAHLNLVLIHPFSDGNGRMARCVQTLVLARSGTVAPAFSSIEEYLGRNTQSYHAVLADVGGGAWRPERNPRPWVRFCLTAHVRQATTLLRRIDETTRLWELLEEQRQRFGFPERSVVALADAAMGFKIRNASYRARAGITDQVASRDLKLLADLGLLVAQGEKRGRLYFGSDELRRNFAKLRTIGKPIPDPFDDPDLPTATTAAT